MELQSAQIEKIVDIYQVWQSKGVNAEMYAEPELFRSVKQQEIEDNEWSLIPSRYIEFIDRDSTLQVNLLMSKAMKETKTLLARQVKNYDFLNRALARLDGNNED